MIKIRQFCAICGWGEVYTDDGDDCAALEDRAVRGLARHYLYVHSESRIQKRRDDMNDQDVIMLSDCGVKSPPSLHTHQLLTKAFAAYLKEFLDD